jgi:hypothetical protein
MSNKFFIIMLFGALYGGSAATFAQKITVQYSASQVYNPYKETVAGVLQGDESGVYILKNEYSGGFLNRSVAPVLQKYDNKLDISFTQAYKISAGDDGRYMLDEFLYMGRGFAMFTSSYDRSTRRQTVYGTRIALDGRAVGKAQSVLEYDFEERADRASINIVTSDDTTKALVYFEVERTTKAENDKLIFGVYDEKLQKIWGKKIVMPYSARKLDIVSCTVGNTGDVFVLCKIYDIDSRQELKKNDDGKKQSAFKYLLLQYNAQSDAPKESEISLPNKQIVSLKYRLTDQGNIIIAGFYSDENSRLRGIGGMLVGQGITGIFYAQIDAQTNQTKAVSLKPFDQKFMQTMGRRGTFKTQNGTLTLSPYFVPQRFILRDDGGVVIVSEYVNIYVTEVRNANGTVSRTYHYDYMDIMITNVDAQGNVVWNAVVPKYQSTVNDGGYMSSYTLMVHGGSLHFIFNDNARNFEPESRGYNNISVRRPQKNVVVIASINNDGAVTKKILIDNKDKKSYLQPRRSRQVNASDVVIYTETPAQRFLGVAFSTNKYGICRLKFE